MEKFSRQQFQDKYKSIVPPNVMENLLSKFQHKLIDLNLPLEMALDIEQIYIPLYYEDLANKHETGKPKIIGICGSQGSGKTTFTELFKTTLEKGFGLKVVSVSIDDFYLTQSERIELSKTIHPLLKTRGVPGTHDVSMGLDIFLKLMQFNSEQEVHIPRFNKAIDDRFPQKYWNVIREQPDAILFEGWCVGAKPQSADDLASPVNQLEVEFDSDGTFRNYVNHKLSTSYQQWFSMIDSLILLRVPSFEKILEWRYLQEEKLRKLHPQGNSDTNKIMSKAEIEFFVSHFERLTKHMLQSMPQQADYIIDIDEDHSMETIWIH